MQICVGWMKVSAGKKQDIFCRKKKTPYLKSLNKIDSSLFFCICIKRMDLQKKIQCLPKELQVMIYEFNPEHRRYTRELYRELRELIYPPCRVCLTPFKNEFCGLDYFIIHKYQIFSHWCDIQCFEEDLDIQNKLKCLTAVDEYMRDYRRDRPN